MQTLEDVLGSRINIAVLRYLTARRGSLSGNEIAKRLGLQQSSVRLALERLVETGVIIRADVGRSAGYAVEFRLAFVRGVLIPLFREEARLADKLMNALVRGSERLNPRPSAVVLFGSVARGERDFRDVDLLCIVAKERDKSPLHDSVVVAYSAVQREFKVPLGVVVATDAELRSAKLESITEQTRRDGLLLHGSMPDELRGIREWQPKDRRGRCLANFPPQ